MKWPASGGASAPLTLTGATDTLQLNVKGAAGQTADVIRIGDNLANFKAGVGYDANGGYIRGVGLSSFNIIGGDGANGTRITVNGGHTFTITTGGGALASHGIGVWGHAAPAAQPATPVTLADVIALLQSYGFCV